MSDIIDINVAQTVEEVTINVVDNVIQVNINTINGVGGGIESVVAGTNITVDNTDPQNPIINANADAVTSVNSDTGAVIVDLESVLNEGNTSTLQINSGNITATDTDGGEAPFRGVFDSNNGNLLMSFLDSNTSFASIFSIETLGSSVSVQFKSRSGLVALDAEIKTVNFTAQIDQSYTANGTITVTDPTPIANKGYIVHVIGGTSTIGGVGYTTGALVYRYYDGSSWISKNYNQDLQSVLTNGGTVIEGDNELYLDVVNGQLEFGTVGAVSSSFFKVNSDEDIIIANANNVSQKNASILLDTDGNLELIQKNATNTFGTGITITEPTANRSITFKDESGTLALISDIPAPITIDANPTDGSSNAVSSNGVFDALATKVSKSDYTPAHSILVQQSGTGTPTALSVGNNTLVGRLSGGGSDINDLSVSDVRTLLSIDTDLALKQDKVTGVSDTEIGYLDGVTSAIQTQINQRVRYWGSAVNGDTVANTLTITPTYSQLIPANTFSAGDVIDLECRLTSPGAKTSISSLYFYVNTSNSVSGATQLGIFSGVATTRTLQASRKLSVKGATSKSIASAVSASSDIIASASMTTHTIDWTVDQYILFAIGHTVADQTLTGDFYTIEKK